MDSAGGSPCRAVRWLSAKYHIDSLSTDLHCSSLTSASHSLHPKPNPNPPPQNELVKELYKEQIMADLMRETEDVASRRKACREMKELLQRAMEIVNEVRDFSPFK